MAKRISERQRLLTYAMTADKEQIEEALDIFKTALASRFEKKERKRKPRQDDVVALSPRARQAIVDVRADTAAAGKGAA